MEATDEDVEEDIIAPEEAAVEVTIAGETEATAVAWDDLVMGKTSTYEWCCCGVVFALGWLLIAACECAGK